MSARDDIRHGGVLRVAGVVHVGPPARQVYWYARDARGYARGLMVEHHLAEARRAAEESDECQRRSWVSALEQLVRWVNGERDTRTADQLGLPEGEVG